MQKAIVFDLWNTLAYNKGSLINPLTILENKLQQKVPFDYKEVERGFMVRKYKSVLKAITSLCKHLGLKPSPEAVRDLLDIWESSQTGFTFFKDVEPVLEEYRKKGYKIGLISNTDCFSIKLFFDSGYKRLFDAIVFSYEVGCLKPDRRMLESILNKMGVKPEETVMVGDNIHDDILPALDIGMKAVLIKRNMEKETGTASWIETGDYENMISTLKELHNIIK